MEDKKFLKLIAIISAAGVISFLALAVYTLIISQDCSIISFIANGR